MIKEVSVYVVLFSGYALFVAVTALWHCCSLTGKKLVWRLVASCVCAHLSLSLYLSYYLLYCLNPFCVDHFLGFGVESIAEKSNSCQVWKPLSNLCTPPLVGLVT